MMRYGIFMCILIFKIVILTSCGFVAGGIDTDYESINNYESYFLNRSQFYDNTLTISVTMDHTTPSTSFGIFQGHTYSVVQLLAERYMDANPGVTILVCTLTDGSSLEAFDRINLEIMSGQADILIDSHVISWQSRAAQNAFTDWYPVITSDPRFCHTQFFTRIFDAIKINGNGNMLAFPISFSYHTVAANNSTPDMADVFSSYSSICFSQMISLHDVYSTNNYFNLASFFDTFEAVIHSIHMFLDINTGHVDFNNREFIQLISRAREIAGNHRDQQIVSPVGLMRHDEQRMSRSYSFYVAAAHVLRYIFPHDGEFLFSGHIPLVNYNQELLVNIQCGFLLNQTATPVQRAIAWDFIYFFIQPENQRGLIPIIQASYKPLFFDQSRQFATDIQNQLQVMDGITFNEISAADAVEYVIQQLYTIADMPMRLSRVDYAVISRSINIILNDFHDGIITAEQAAADIQNRVSLLIMELGI